MAVWQRQPQAGLIVHSDLGSQYASKQHRQLLKIRGFISSMSRVGNCWENKRSAVSRADKREDRVRHDSVAERLFGSLKQEQIHRQCYLTRYAAQQACVAVYFLLYNSHRLHSYLGYKNPNQYEAEMEMLKYVA